MTAFDDFSEAAQTLLELQRSLYGSQSPFFELREEILGLTNSAINAQNAIADAAISRDSPFSSSTIPTNDNQSVVSAIDRQTTTIVDALSAGLGAVNSNVITLVRQNAVSRGAEFGGMQFASNF